MSAFQRRHAAKLPRLFHLLFILAALLPSPPVASAVFINFENCLDTSIVHSNPLQLQLVPLFLDARFNTTAPSHNLNLTVWGNVSGQAVEGTYPAPQDSSWSNPNDTFGKITDIGSADKFSTLLARFGLLTYDAYNAPATEFCPAVINGTCPLGPVFGRNNTNAYDLPAFSIAHDFYSSYAFGTLVATVRVISGDTGGPDLACVSANITPDLGPRVSGLLTWLPAAILMLKGVATLAAAVWSPWGSSDIFRWSSNYGRDEDLLRLVTPGFGDCLQYIQFVTLTGALSLQYPGFFQPAVSQLGWSVLLFNNSFVSGGNGTHSLQDGIYVTNGTYGLTKMSQLIGMSAVDDVWACMAIYLLVIAAAVVLLCQLGFLSRWIYRRATDTSEEDLRHKNLPFTAGNLIRLTFNYFILPIVALSLYQLVIAPRSPTSVVACAVILLALTLLASGWLLKVIFTTKPRTHLFDDMPTVLLYGPLYNTYSDSAAPFALIPVFITFMRGVAIGAVQPSGIAQIIVLAICEVILVLTLNAFRPFQNQTSMNAYHTFFAVARLVTVMLSVAFVPSLGVGEATKGWIGYAILLLHACVLVFGFFLNAAQTLIEVIARSLGVAGHDAQTGAVRGSILNLRMLKKRQDRLRPATGGDRGSMTSNAAILQDADSRSAYAAAGGRSRSLSASSQQLLNQVGNSGGNSVHRISGFESFGGEFVGTPGAETDGVGGGLAPPGYLPDGIPTGVLKRSKTNEGVGGATETFYRPPRPRKNTIDALSNPAPTGVQAAHKTRISATSGDIPYADSPGQSPPDARVASGSYEGAATLNPYSNGRDSSALGYFRERADSETAVAEQPRPDYAVREVDQYYRGVALSDQPARKLKTGPADPEGPAASAQTWFQRLLVGVRAGGLGVGKRKESGKGFEVVRSGRMPVELRTEMELEEARRIGVGMGRGRGEDVEMVNSPGLVHEPYRDEPPQALAGAERGVDEPAPSKFGFDGAGDDKKLYSGPLSPIDGNNQIVVRHVTSGTEAATLAHPNPVRSVESSAASTSQAADHPGIRAEQPPHSFDSPPRSRPSRDTTTTTAAASSNYPPPSRDGLAPSSSASTTETHPYNSDLYSSSAAPTLAPIQHLPAINLPSRFNSRRSANELSLADSTSGQGWLAAVDGLQWPAHTRADAPGNAPGLPRRSSRRTPSADNTPQFSRSPSYQRGTGGAGGEDRGVFAGFDSAQNPPHERTRGGEWIDPAPGGLGRRYSHEH